MESTMCNLHKVRFGTYFVKRIKFSRDIDSSQEPTRERTFQHECMQKYMRVRDGTHPTVIILTHASEELRANLLCEQGSALARTYVTAEKISLDLSTCCTADNEPNRLTFTLTVAPLTNDWNCS